MTATWRPLSFFDTARTITFDLTFPVPHGSTTLSLGNTDERFGDANETALSREMLYSTCRMGTDHAVRMKVEHGVKISIVDDGPGGIFCDGLITRRRGIPLSVGTADCVPLMVTDRAQSIVGLIHVSRHNSAPGSSGRAGIIEEMISVFQSMGVYPGELVVLLGPSLRQCHYTFPEQASLVAARLQSLGVPRRQISAVDVCTFHSVDVRHGGFLFPSHRRVDNAQKQKRVVRGNRFVPEREARFETAVMLPEET